MSEDMTFDLVWMQRLGGGTETLERGIPIAQAMIRLVEADRQDHGVGGVCFLRPSGEDSGESEIAHLREQLADVMRAGDMEHARMAALYEACEATAAFIESYDDRSMLATALPTTYANLRVYGKNARAAVEAVRAQADAMVARLADLSRQIGEQHTTIGYQDAMLSEMRKTLDAAHHGLMSYACGNSAPALAEEMAAEIARVLGKASME